MKTIEAFEFTLTKVWELDWSFSYKKGEEDMEMIIAREQVEDMLSGINKEDSK